MSSSSLALYGAVTGTFGLIVSLLVYLRDAPRVRVLMRFDMKGFGSVPGVLHCVIAVHNVGRRTIYLERAHIPPTTCGGQTYIFEQTMQNITLAEGAAPHIYHFQQAGFESEQISAEWWRIRALVWDASGRPHRSRWITERPSFATTDPPPFAIPVAKLHNWLEDMRLRLLA